MIASCFTTLQPYNKVLDWLSHVPAIIANPTRGKGDNRLGAPPFAGRYVSRRVGNVHT